MLNALNSDPPQSNAEYVVITLCLSNQTQQPHAIVLKPNALGVHCYLQLHVKLHTTTSGIVFHSVQMWYHNLGY